MNREQRLTFAHVLIGRIREDLLDVAGDSRLNVGKPRFVDGDSSRGPDLILHRFAFNRSEFHSDRLQSFRGELDRCEGSLCRWWC